MNKPTGFHVRHDLAPTHTHELLILLHATTSPQTAQDLQQAATQRGYKLRARKDYSKLLKSLTELRVLREEKGGVMLTDIGRIIVRMTMLQPDLLSEFIHFLYSVEHENNAGQRFSWSYRRVCNWLWETAPCPVNRDRLVNLVTASAAETFGLTGISFSISSIAGILNWVSTLSPQCIVTNRDGEYFRRRSECPIEVFILALDHVFRQYNSTDPQFVPLGAEFRQRVCEICLLASDAFDEMLNQAVTSFPCIQLRRERGDRIKIHEFSWFMLEN